MDNKCEELLADSVINNRYPNKAKQIIRYLYFFSTVINTPVENFIKTFMEKCGKVSTEDFLHVEKDWGYFSKKDVSVSM